MINRDPEKNFEHLWQTFYNRYPFFELREVDWRKQYTSYRPRVTKNTSEEELFDVFCEMLAPLDDGHVELLAKITGEARKRIFTPETKPNFWQEFSKRQIKQLFDVTEETLIANGFSNLKKTEAWILQYCRSQSYGYIRILELEGVGIRTLTNALLPSSRRRHAPALASTTNTAWRSVAPAVGAAGSNSEAMHITMRAAA